MSNGCNAIKQSPPLLNTTDQNLYLRLKDSAREMYPKVPYYFYIIIILAKVINIQFIFKNDFPSRYVLLVWQERICCSCFIFIVSVVSIQSWVLSCRSAYIAIIILF